MAEFLIMSKRHWSYKENMTAEEQAKYDKQYQIGDIVQVYPDGTLTEKITSPRLVAIKISGLSYDLAKKYQEELSENHVLVKRRKFRIRVADLPKSVRDALEVDKEYSTTWDNVKTYIRNNITGVDEK